MVLSFRMLANMHTAPDKQIRWNIRLIEEHGIRNFSMGDARLDLVCAARKSFGDEATVTVCSETPICLILNRDNIEKKVDIHANETISINV